MTWFLYVLCGDGAACRRTGIRLGISTNIKVSRELIELSNGLDARLFETGRPNERAALAVHAKMPRISRTSADASVDAIVIDPPYCDNLMYAELSDFFYVWLKSTAGLFIRNCSERLTDKEHEAVANPARFDGQRGAEALADADYRDKMAAIFRECRRVLKPNGIMTLMFTHKATGAWDALRRALSKPVS